MKFKIGDVVYEKANGQRWEITEKASALEDEPPVKWKCGHWVIGRPERTFVELIFEESMITHLEPVVGHIR